VRETAHRGKVRRDVTQLTELEASESSISPLVRPQLPPLAGLVIALSRLLEGKTPVEREREEACSHQSMLERSLRKGREGLLYWLLGTSVRENHHKSERASLHWLPKDVLLR